MYIATSIATYIATSKHTWESDLNEGKIQDLERRVGGLISEVVDTAPSEAVAIAIARVFTFWRHKNNSKSGMNIRSQMGILWYSKSSN